MYPVVKREEKRRERGGKGALCSSTKLSTTRGSKKVESPARVTNKKKKSLEGRKGKEEIKKKKWAFTRLLHNGQ